MSTEISFKCKYKTYSFKRIDFEKSLWKILSAHEQKQYPKKLVPISTDVWDNMKDLLELIDTPDELNQRDEENSVYNIMMDVYEDSIESFSEIE